MELHFRLHKVPWVRHASRRHRGWGTLHFAKAFSREAAGGNTGGFLSSAIQSSHHADSGAVGNGLAAPASLRTTPYRINAGSEHSLTARLENNRSEGKR
jgi:hypothetical protein